VFGSQSSSSSCRASAPPCVTARVIKTTFRNFAKIISKQVLTLLFSPPSPFSFPHRPVSGSQLEDSEGADVEPAELGAAGVHGGGGGASARRAVGSSVAHVMRHRGGLTSTALLRDFHKLLFFRAASNRRHHHVIKIATPPPLCQRHVVYVA